MLHVHQTECNATDLVCKVLIKLDGDSLLKYNFDLWINEDFLLFNWNNINRRITSNSKFDYKDVQNLVINIDKNNTTLFFEIPCLPDYTKENKEILNNKPPIKKAGKSFDILKLRRITQNCILKVEGIEKPINFTYGYGFNGHFNEDTSLVKSELKQICRIRDPSHKSAIERFHKREVDEAKDFSQEQYKLNFIELQVPEGLENPMNYTFTFNDINLNSKEEYTLQRICSKASVSYDSSNCQRINNELVGILLAICYDIRTNGGEINCESGWTRSILSPVLSYFEPTINLESAIEIFLRRSLIYPIYRNYDLSRLCVEDTIQALQKSQKWIIKQLITTYYSFLECDDSRQLLNKYFIEDYILYVSSGVTVDELKFLSKNVKNSLSRISKKNIRLKLLEIETDLLKELISDIHLGNSNDSDDYSDNTSDDDDDDDDDDSDDETSSSESNDENNETTKESNNIMNNL